MVARMGSETQFRLHHEPMGSWSLPLVRDRLVMPPPLKESRVKCNTSGMHLMIATRNADRQDESRAGCPPRSEWRKHRASPWQTVVPVAGSQARLGKFIQRQECTLAKATTLATIAAHGPG